MELVFLLSSTRFADNVDDLCNSLVQSDIEAFVKDLKDSNDVDECIRYYSIGLDLDTLECNIPAHYHIRSVLLNFFDGNKSPDATYKKAYQALSCVLLKLFNYFGEDGFYKCIKNDRIHGYIKQLESQKLESLLERHNLKRKRG